MDERTRYLVAFGAFRQQLAGLSLSARTLDEAAKAYDPDGTAEPEPIVLSLFAECVAELKVMRASIRGIRQLLTMALED